MYAGRLSFTAIPRIKMLSNKGFRNWTILIRMTKVFVLGIDGAAPELIFEKWLDELPTIQKLMRKGQYARIFSSVPPATLIAWNSFVSGRDAGELGVYSYMKKSVKTREESELVNSTSIKKERIWKVLGKEGKRSIVLNVPLTCPVEELNGVMVSDFLTPDINADCAYPPSLKEKIRKLGNADYYFDVAEFIGYKDLDIDLLLKRVYEMTDMQLRLLKDLMVHEKWDFCMEVLIGSDRIQHMLWNHFDETHWNYIENSPHKDALKNYYKYVDKELGKILELLDDDTVIIVSSDHGMIPHRGKININEWLRTEGYLVLKKDFEKEIAGKKARLRIHGIDFSKTTVHEVGAYHARFYINKKGRDPQGVVPAEKYEAFRDELAKKLQAIMDDKGRKLKTKIFKPEEVYCNGFDENAPDLIVYFDDLQWCANPNLGYNGLYSWETGTGSDAAGHAPYGIFVMAGKGIPQRGGRGTINILDGTPTLLKLFKLPVPKGMQGKALI